MLFFHARVYRVSLGFIVSETNLNDLLVLPNNVILMRNTQSNNGVRIMISHSQSNTAYIGIEGPFIGDFLSTTCTCCYQYRVIHAPICR